MTTFPAERGMIGIFAESIGDSNPVSISGRCTSRRVQRRVGASGLRGGERAF